MPDIRNRHHSLKNTVLIDDRNAADLIFIHEIGGPLSFLLRLANDNVGGCHTLLHRTALGSLSIAITARHRSRSVTTPITLRSVGDFTTGRTRVRTLFDEWRLERAIGVISVPETERLSHYFYATLPAQFDAVLHFDQTHAVDPLRWSTDVVG